MTYINKSINFCSVKSTRFHVAPCSLSYRMAAAPEHGDGPAAAPENLALVFLDIETSGLSFKTEKILSVSASFKDKEFHSYVNPNKIIPKEATKINGITNEMVKDAPEWSVVSNNLFQWIFDNAGPSPTLCCYNGIRFDVPFIIKENENVDTSKFPVFQQVYHVDPFHIAQKAINRAECGNFKQASVYQWLFGAEPEDQHTSHGDVKALKRIMDADLFKDNACAYKKELFSMYKFK